MKRRMRFMLAALLVILSASSAEDGFFVVYPDDAPMVIVEYGLIFVRDENILNR
jgi:hypothetical protein